MDERRRPDERTGWAWDPALRSAYHEAVTKVLDPKAVKAAQAPALVHAAPRVSLRDRFFS